MSKNSQFSKTSKSRLLAISCHVVPAKASQKASKLPDNFNPLQPSIACKSISLLFNLVHACSWCTDRLRLLPAYGRTRPFIPRAAVSYLPTMAVELKHGAAHNHAWRAELQQVDAIAINPSSTYFLPSTFRPSSADNTAPAEPSQRSGDITQPLCHETTTKVSFLRCSLDHLRNATLILHKLTI